MGLFNNREKMWFGTEQKMGWIDTPNTGADVSSVGMNADVDLLNGGGATRNSWDSHKVHQFSWGESASPSLVSLLQAYRNGSYGRGFLYFHDPMYYGTNILPKRWADPSMAINYEAEPIVPDLWPTGSPVAATTSNYPVTAAVYPLPAGYSSQANDSEHFIPIPEGFSLVLGAVYAGGEVYVRTPAGITVIPSMSTSDQAVVNISVSGQPWARLGLRNTSGSTVNMSITGMTARLTDSLPTGEGQAFSYTNLFTHPSFELASGSIEVRRNRAKTPNHTGSETNWASNDGSLYVRTFAPGEGRRPGSNAAKFSRTATSPGPAIASSFGAGVIQWDVAGRVAVTAGSTLTVSVYTKANVDFFTSVGVLFYDAAGGTIGSIVSGATIPGSANTWVRPSVTTTVPATVTNVGIGALNISRQSGTTSGTEIAWACDALYETASVVREYMDGAYSPDGDLTPAWAGTAGQSESTLSGIPVSGVTAVNCFAIRSTRWVQAGTYSMRLIPSGASNDSYAWFTIPASARPGGTVLGTVHLESPLAGTLHARSRRISVDTPFSSSSQPANLSGTYDLRLNYGELSSGYTARLYNGGSADSGDVWWDCAGIFEGNYSNVWFDGSSPGASWSGTPNASTSNWASYTPITGDLGAGPWMSGEGHSGCRFVGNPTVINYNGIEGGRIGISCVLKEVGAWA